MAFATRCRTIIVFIYLIAIVVQPFRNFRVNLDFRSEQGLKVAAREVALDDGPQDLKVPHDGLCMIVPKYYADVMFTQSF